MDRNPTMHSRSIPEWGFSSDPRSSAEDLDRVRSVAEMRSCFLHLFRQGHLGAYLGTCGMIRTMIPSIAGSADGGRQRPAQPPQRDDLLSLLFAQDIAHIDGGYPSRRSQCPVSASLAGFQTSLIGRFWVIPEAQTSRTRQRCLFHDARGAHKALGSPRSSKANCSFHGRGCVTQVGICRRSGNHCRICFRKATSRFRFGPTSKGIASSCVGGQTRGILLSTH